VPRNLWNNLVVFLVLQMAEGVEFLLKRYPDYIAVDFLPLDTVQERVIWFSLLCKSNGVSISVFVMLAQITFY